MPEDEAGNFKLRIRPPFVDGALLGEVVVRAATCPRERVAQDVIELLGIEPTDAVLQLGCGSGRMLSVVATRVRQGFAAGIDPSELMVSQARLRDGPWIVSGRVQAQVGHSGDLSAFPGGRFDAAFGVHVYFWDEPRRHIAEIRRVIREGGRLLLGFWTGAEHQAPRAAADRVRFDPERAEHLLHESGFRDVRSELRSERGRPLAWVQGRT